MPGDPDEHSPAADRFIDSNEDVVVDQATLPENTALLRELDAQIAAYPKYGFVSRDQAGAEVILRRIGALDEIEHAVVTQSEWATPPAPLPTPPPAPKYEPQVIKKLLQTSGWRPEVRVPPYNPAYDSLPSNDRYDLYKAFEDGGRRIGVAIEIERWEVWNDLLKFRRGRHRGQITVGVIIHDNPADLAYVTEHLRLMSEPLFGEIPILFCSPAGGGLPTLYEPTSRNLGPFLMPG